jgi:hypothetical protein
MRRSLSLEKLNLQRSIYHPSDEPLEQTSPLHTTEIQTA